MKKRILFIGGGGSMARAVVSAGKLGYQTVAVDNTPHSAVIAAAQEGIAADIANEVELTRVARSAHVDGIYPALEPSCIVAARTAAALNLPSLPPDAVALACDKYAMRRALGGCGILQPTFCVASSEREAVAAAESVRPPVIVKPGDGSGSEGVRRVDHIEDVPLAYAQAARVSGGGNVLVESVVEGRHLTIDGAVHCGLFRPFSAHGAIPAPAPCCYDVALYAPLEAELVRGLAATADAVARALKITDGVFSAEFVAIKKDFFLVELHPYPAHLCLPVDLLRLTTDNEAVGSVLRACTGDMAGKGYAPVPLRSAAIAWIPTRSGIVMAVEGAGDARAVPGVVEVRVTAKPGDVMGHAVDAFTRDRVGYAVATGDSAGEALDTAQKACGLCRIVTSPALH